jgi:hypothetical protein
MTAPASITVRSTVFQAPAFIVGHMIEDRRPIFYIDGDGLGIIRSERVDDRYVRLTFRDDYAAAEFALRFA